MALGLASVVALEAVALTGWMGWHMPRPVRPAPIAVALGAAVEMAPAALPPAVAAATVMAAAEIPVKADVAPIPERRYYEQLRRRLRWLPTRLGEEELRTPDLASRLLLAKSAARRAGLQEVGLGFSDVYGIINAESSWVPRQGASKDGTPNLGIAQFEPATARMLGLRDANDPVEAVHVAALHMKQAALWSESRLAHLKLDADTRAEKLREGVSIYYNLSSRGRSAWNGRNTAQLPKETRLHIQNARAGALEASLLEAQLRAGAYRGGNAVITAGN